MQFETYVFNASTSTSPPKFNYVISNHFRDLPISGGVNGNKNTLQFKPDKYMGSNHLDMGNEVENTFMVPDSKIL